MTRLFDVVKNITKIETGRQFIYNRVPVKLNDFTKQINQNRFLKTNRGEKFVVGSNCKKWGNFNVRLRKKN